MPKSRRSKRAFSRSSSSSYSEKNLSPVIKFGIVFFWIAVIVVVAYVVKMYV